MDFHYLFLQPQGRLAPRPFARGLVVLTGAMMAVMVLSVAASPGFGILQYTLVFPYLCLFGKRLHDAGLSAWLWLGFLAGFGFFNMFFSAILLPALSPEAFKLQAEIGALIESDGFNAAWEELARRAPDYARLSAVTAVTSFLLASALTGFAAWRMRSDPNPNRHGPPGMARTFN